MTLYAFTQTKRRAFQFTARPLQAATGVMFGRVNPSGTKVLFWQRVGAGGTTALSIIPFDSGPALQVGAPVQDFENYNWAAGGEGVLMVRRRGDRFVVTETDPSTRVVKEIGTVPAPAGARVSVIPISGGGTLVAVWSSGNCDLRPIGVPGAPDTTFHVPANWCYTAPVPAPNRAEAILSIVERSTVQLMSISLASGRIAPLTPPLARSLIPVKWLPNGAILLMLDESDEVEGLYRIAAPGAAPERIGSLPRAEQLYSFSADAQHAVASVSEPRRDVFLVNSFKGLLGQKP